MLGYSIKCIVDSCTQLGESPLWDESKSILYWIDILEPKLHWMDFSARSHGSSALPKIPGSVALRKRGGLLVVFRNGLAFLDNPAGEAEFCKLDLNLGDERFNDAKCDAKGRLWVGTLDRHLRSDSAALYRISSTLACDRMDAPFSLGNGLAWSPDYKRMYFTDTRTRTIHQYDFDLENGSVTNRRVFMRLSEDVSGRPDGCAVDADGFVWSAMIGGGRISRFDPDGKLAQNIHLPIRNPTSCCFGGPSFKTLYVTSARETSTEGPALGLQEGGLFAVEVDVRGMPVSEFGG